MKNLLFLMLILPAIVKGQIINTIAGNWFPGYAGDGGPATAAQLFEPNQLTVDRLGNVYIADAGNNVVRKVDTAGIITTFAGNGAAVDSGDGEQATAAALYAPIDVIFDTSGNLFISDNGNYIRKVNTAGIISTFAGNGVAGYTGDGGLADTASFNGIYGIAFDGRGNMYIAERYNNVIRKINATGIVSTVAGSGAPAYYGDGGLALDALLNHPTDVKIDKGGNIYIADYYNSRVRKIDSAGFISTIAGNGVPGYSGDGGPAYAAELNYPYAICFDLSGDLYITDNGNELVRQINTSGIIETVAGNGLAGFSGDGGPATAAEIYNAAGITTDTFGNLYIADFGNNVIREVNNTGATTDVFAVTGNGTTELYIYPNPATTQLTITASSVISEITITNLLGQTVYSSQYSGGSQASIDVSELPSGVYFVKVNGTDVRKIVKQ